MYCLLIVGGRPCASNRQRDCNMIMDKIIMKFIIWIFSSSNPTPWPILSTGHHLHDHIWVPPPSPGIVSVPLCICQADHVKSSPSAIIVPRVVVVVVVHASVVNLVYVCSSLVWIDASPALCKEFEYIHGLRFILKGNLLLMIYDISETLSPLCYY